MQILQMINIVNKSRQTHIDYAGGTAVQVLVELIQHLPQLLHGLLSGLEEHGLKVDRQAVPGEV